MPNDLSNPQRKATLTGLEKVVKESGSFLRVSQPALFVRLMQTTDAVRLGKASIADVQALSLELSRWQLTVQRAAFAEQLASLHGFTLQGLPWALDTASALEALIHLLDRALAQTRPDATPATPEAAEMMRRLGQAATAKLERAQKAIKAARRSPAPTPSAPALTAQLRARHHIAAR